MVDTKNTLESGASLEGSSESQPVLAVRAPESAQKLTELVDTISLLETVDERIGEKPSDQVATGSGTKTSSPAVRKTSVRDAAIAALPTENKLRANLTKHIEKEVASLEKEARALSRKSTKAGGAWKLNQLYTRIRQLKGLLAELLDASVDIVKRLYIRVFIDKQKVL